MAKKRATAKQLTVSTEGVFSEGVRQLQPDPFQVAQVLAAPEPVSLWVRDQTIIAALEQAIESLPLPNLSERPKSVQNLSAKTPKEKVNGHSVNELQEGSNNNNLSLFSTENENLSTRDPNRDGGILNSAGTEEDGLLEADELLWGQRENDGATLVQRFKTRFYPVAGGVGFFAGQTPFFLPLSEREAAFVTARLTARNAALGLLTPRKLTETASSIGIADGQTSDAITEAALVSFGDAVSSTTSHPTVNSGSGAGQDALQPVVSEAVRYFLHTGQEIDILERSAADGKRGENWKNEEIVGKRIYQALGASHRVELRERDESEISQGMEELNLATLERLTLSQDTDFAFAMLYIAAALAPPGPLPNNQFTGGWIDLDDVMEKIGWYPSVLTIADRETKRARIWDYLCYGNRAVVVGQRSGSYRDSQTGEEISTRIESPIWRIMSIERPVQEGLSGEVPRRVQLVISKEWEPMLVSARLAQYLPLAEVIGKIPPQKVAGDWARSIALVLARLWRMKPQAFLAGELRPTRRELLNHYKPKTKTADELLSSSNPKRAVNYWRDALGILCESGFLSSKGEATRTVAQMLEPHSSYRWQQAWLDEAIELHPGEALLLSLQERAASLPILPPAPLRKKQGRPRKKRTE